jgi:hypothetical protein
LYLAAHNSKAFFLYPQMFCVCIVNSTSCVPTYSYRRAKQFRDLLARKHGVDSGLAMIIKQRAKVSDTVAYVISTELSPIVPRVSDEAC